MHLDLVEGLGHEVGDGLVSLDDESHGGKLAAAVAEELVGQVHGELLLQPHRLEAGERRPDPQV